MLRLRMLGVLSTALVLGCATTNPTRPVVPIAADPNDRCLHGVACETCVRCHPDLATRFKAAGDWCPEHGVPESQCGICHPEVVVAPPTPPPGADVQWIATGTDLPSLDPFAVRGKITVFDFYADWCGPCRHVDEHVFALLRRRNDVAYRKLNIVTWESALARHYLSKVTSLPYAIIYGRDGRPAGTMTGLQLGDLDRAISVGETR